MILRKKLLQWVLPIFLVLLLYEMMLTEAYMKSVRIEEIPFGLSDEENDRNRNNKMPDGVEHSAGIHALSKLKEPRKFFHLFNVAKIVCFFAAKGKWPFIPAFMKMRVDSVSKTLFSKNDSSIKQFCQKWISIKECFRPIFAPTTVVAEIESIANLRSTACSCAKTGQLDSVVYFDKDYIGNVSSETIYNTIEFLQSFLPPPTKKPKRKNHVRGRLDEMDID